MGRAPRDGYEELALSGELVVVLFGFTAARREVEARSVLASSHLQVATAVLVAEVTPDQAIWLPVVAGSKRRQLAELEESLNSTPNSYSS